MENHLPPKLIIELLDILPNPVWIKNQYRKYVWVNRAFESLFSLDRNNIVGKEDKELFPHRQVAQCSGGDIRVLASGNVDDSIETVYDKNGIPRKTITRKNRLKISVSEIYLVGVMHDVTEVTRANEALTTSYKKLEEQAAELSIRATTDMLTGCSNRRMLEVCNKSLTKNKRQSAAVLVMDIDKFKSINDQFGHEVGDTVLRHFCDVTRTLLNPDDHFIRLGGEEFVIILANITFEDMSNKAEAIRKLVEKTSIAVNNKSFKFTVSIGCAFKGNGLRADIDDMLREADDNVYVAKEGGRNQVIVAA